jgi:Collagen triple helix repeat (20 copies)
LKRTTIIAVALALVVGLAGSATAASLLTGKDIKNGSLTGADIENGSVYLGDLTEGAQARIADAGTPGNDGAQGPAGTSGAKGDSGAAGAKGDTGAPGAAGAKGEKGEPGSDGTKGKDGVVEIVRDGPDVRNVAAAPGDFGDRKGGTLIRDLDLPAGTWDIQATMSVRGPASGVDEGTPAYVRCNLVNATNDSEIDTFYRSFFRNDGGPAGFREGLSVGAAVTLDAPTKVEVKCHTSYATADGNIASSKLLATSVQKLTIQN